MANTHVIKIHCKKCGALLYKYLKVKPGFLIKCYHDKILEDHTNGDLKCPKCGQEFARFKMIKGRPANKMIHGKFTIQGHLKRDG